MRWLRQLFSRQRRYDDLAVSLREHLEEAIDEMMSSGMSRSEAERVAHRRLGNVSLIEQRGREAWQFSLLESVLADIRFAWRQRWRSRGVTAVVVLTLALGIGAVTAVFSVAYGVLVNPFPYKDASTLVAPKLCWPESSQCSSDDFSPAQFLEFQQKTTLFQAVTASTVGKVTVTGNGEAQQIRGNYVSANTFDVFGVQPLLGRASTPEDVTAGHEPVALLSHRYWLSQFGGATSVLGHVITVDGNPRTIVGVLPPHFLWRGADVYLPVLMTSAMEIEGHSRFTFIARVKPGVTDAQATGELQPLFQDFIQADPHRYPKDMRISGLIALPELFKSGLAGTLYLLLAAVFILLLIACVNVSSLLLANAVTREHEFVLRTAIGASRLRLIRQVMIEALLLAVLAIPVALTFAYGGLQAMLHMVPADTIPDEAHIALNIPVLAISIGIAVLIVLIAGMSPAWHSANPRLSGVLTSTRATESSVHRRILNAFVVTEIALSLVLLALAGLMMRSMIAVQRVPTIFPPDRTVMMRVPLVPKRYATPAAKVRFFSHLVEEISHLPGITAATVDSQMPFLMGYFGQVRVGGQTPGSNDFDMLHFVTPAYVNMAKLRVLEGHFIDDREISTRAHDLVVSEDFAQRYFPNGSALGQTVNLVNSFLEGREDHSEPAFTIVGIVDQLPALPGNQRKRPDLFLPYTAAPVMDTVIAITKLPAEDLVQPIHRIVTTMDRDQPVADAMTLRQLLNRYGYASPRFAFTLFGTFAGVALLLSMIGIYGVFSFATSRRTHEIGIRMALGARRSEVVSMILRQACRLSAAGVAVGLPLAFMAGRLAKVQLFHTSEYDPITFVIAIVLLPLLAVAGSWIPARRAAGIEPMAALRLE